MAKVQVRYIVNNVDEAIEFYTKHLGFKLDTHPVPPFAMLSRNDLRLVLSASNPSGGGGQPMPDGTKQIPGGWNRFAIEVADITAFVDTLQKARVHFRNNIVIGVGGKQIIVDDPSGNPIELFEPALPAARLDNKPNNTAVRTALWRAIHVREDAKPSILEDEVGLKLIAPDDDWQQRPDMHPQFTKRIRASIVARARFIEDLIIEQSKKGISQYVILGAGLDSFVQRRPDIVSKLQVFEIDQPGSQAWKQQRLIELGFGIPKLLHFVSVNFETSSWWEQLSKSAFDNSKPAVVACTGVSLYLTKDAIISMLKQIAALAPGSKLAMTFYLPMELIDEEDKALQQMAEKGAREAGTPFVSFFAPNEILALAHDAGFKDAKAISPKDLEQLYFIGRTDHLLPASGELFLLATT